MLFGSCCYAFSFENIEETFFSLFWAEKKLYTIKNSLSNKKCTIKSSLGGQNITWESCSWRIAPNTTMPPPRPPTSLGETPMEN